MTEHTVKVQCISCNTMHEIPVPEAGWRKWVNGEFIQNALPSLSAEGLLLLTNDGELLLSQTCGKCWDEMFGDM